jgi:hypothetical protein
MSFGKAIAGFGLFTLIFQLAFYAAAGFLIGSVTTSGVKAFNKDCGTTYQIEQYVNGNFFCK